MVEALDQDRPDGLGIVGYARPESMAAARWANRHGRPAILMSESQAIDRPRAWWKELIKKRRLRRFDAALVGGPAHRDYLVELGMPPDTSRPGIQRGRQRLFRRPRPSRWRESPDGRSGLPGAPYFLTVCRFVPEKNLVRLIRAFARYRRQCDRGHGVGPGPLRRRSRARPKSTRRSRAAAAGRRSTGPGFLQADSLPRWYAHAGAFVLPSLSEPWGLVVNEAAASGLPLLVSTHAGCAATLVPEPEGTTGGRFDPLDVEAMTSKLAWMAALSDEARRAMGLRAAEVVSHWGPDRFARGVMEALELARSTHGERTPGCALSSIGSRRKRDESDAWKRTPDRAEAPPLAPRRRDRHAPTRRNCAARLAASLQRAGPGARRRHGAEYPGNDGSLEPAPR